MASSGRVPQEVINLMGQTLVVRESTSARQTDEYGENDASGGPSRNVKCYLAPAVVIEGGSVRRDITATYVAYCDDIDLEGNELVTTPDGVDRQASGIETFYDEHGKLYQVLTVD